MYDNELLDVLSARARPAAATAPPLGSYHCPFIFANFNGTSHDVEVIRTRPATPSPTPTGRFIVPGECQWPLS